MKAALVGKDDFPNNPFLDRFNGVPEYFPREMPRLYGPARTDTHGNRPNPLDGAKPEDHPHPTPTPTAGAGSLLPATRPTLGPRPTGSSLAGPVPPPHAKRRRGRF